MAAGNRVAKITLSADTQELTRKVNETKKLFQSLGQVDVSRATRRDIHSSQIGQLNELAGRVKNRLEEVKSELVKIGKASSDAFDPTKLRTLLMEASRLKAAYSDIGRISGGGGVGGRGGGVGGGGGTVSQIASALSKNQIVRLVGGAFAIGTGIALFRRQLGISRQFQDIRGLTGIGGLPDALTGAGGSLGFATDERRQRAIGLASALGRDVSSNELTSLVNKGEVLQRAYGVSQQGVSGLLGAGRRAGMGTEVLSQTVGQARAAGLRGSRVEEYLDSIAQGISSMSQGININRDSFTGMMGWMLSMPFFKNDPQRGLAAAQSLNQAFTSGDRFQQAMAARAIQLAAGSPIRPAGVETRRRMGLFGGFKKSELDDLKNLDEETKQALGVSGSSIIAKIFSNVMGATEGLPQISRLNAFLNATTLQPGPGVSIFNRLLQNGGQIDEKEFNKMVNAGSDGNPAELARQRLETERNLLQTNVKLSESMDQLSGLFGGAGGKILNDLTGSLRDFLKGFDIQTVTKQATDMWDGAKTVFIELKDAVIELKDTLQNSWLFRGIKSQPAPGTSPQEMEEFRNMKNPIGQGLKWLWDRLQQSGDSSLFKGNSPMTLGMSYAPGVESDSNARLVAVLESLVTAITQNSDTVRGSSRMHRRNMTIGKQSYA